MLIASDHALLNRGSDGGGARLAMAFLDLEFRIGRLCPIFHRSLRLGSLRDIGEMIFYHSTDSVEIDRVIDDSWGGKDLGEDVGRAIGEVDFVVSHGSLSGWIGGGRSWCTLDWRNPAARFDVGTGLAMLKNEVGTVTPEAPCSVRVRVSEVISGRGRTDKIIGSGDRATRYRSIR